MSWSPSAISGAAVTPKPRRAPSAASVATSPARLRPKQKSAPTATWARPRRRVRISSQKARGDSAARSASKGRTNSRSTPIFSSRCVLAPKLINSKGGASGFRNRRGWGSKVTTASGASGRAARAASMTDRWPRWTPSKFPRAAVAPRSSACAESAPRTTRITPLRGLSRRSRSTAPRGGAGWVSPRDFWISSAAGRRAYAGRARQSNLAEGAITSASPFSTGLPSTRQTQSSVTRRLA